MMMKRPTEEWVRNSPNGRKQWAIERELVTIHFVIEGSGQQAARTNVCVFLRSRDRWSDAGTGRTHTLSQGRRWPKGFMLDTAVPAG